MDKCLCELGYSPNFVKDINEELIKLFAEIDFESIKKRAGLALELRDIEGLIKSLKDLMFLLEGKGIYRPDAPIRLIKLLINGLNLKNEDIFYVISRARITLEEKLKEQEFLASCAAITQLGYILLNLLDLEVKAASSGEHVFLVIDGSSPDSRIIVDFSIDSIKEINVSIYDLKENNWLLIKDQNFSDLDAETADYLTKYYSFFRLTSGIGLNHNIHNNLGLAYDKIGRFEDAIKELEEAQRLNPDYIEVHNNIAVIYYKMGMIEEAEKELVEAIRLNPGYLEAHCNLGNIYSNSSRPDDAIKEFNEALRIKPDYAPAHNNLGDIYAIKKLNEEAINEYKEALRVDPNYASPHNNLGNLYFESRIFDDALREFNEALKIESFSPEAHYGIGLVHYELKRYEKASQAFIKAVYYSPELLDIVPDKLILKVRQGVSRLMQ